MSFDNLGLSEKITQMLTQQGFEKPTPIQQEAIPVVLKKQDILGIAKTGSGKTACYALPIIQMIGSERSRDERSARVLVLVPTRELAIQVADVFDKFSVASDVQLKTMAVFGGVSINPQMKSLHNIDILVATPGRLIELEEKNAIKLTSVRHFVLDEADKMLNMGFKDQLTTITNKLSMMRQNLLFSATLSKHIEKLHSLILMSPKVIKIDEDELDIEQIEQIAYGVGQEGKGPLLRNLIRSQNMKQVLVFTSSIQRCDNVANKLRANGIQAWPIHSKRTQGARTDLLTKFKYGKLQVLVATDLVSRGIDIEGLPYVINYELPRSPKDFIHRIGRTGRADQHGKAITFVSPEDEHHFRVIQKKMKKRVDIIDSKDLDIG